MAEPIEGAADRDAAIRMDQRRRQAKVKLWLAGGVAAVLALAMTTAPQTKDASKAAPVHKVSAKQLSACREALKDFREGGLIRDRPEPVQVDVDEGVWEALPYKQKPLVLAAVACDVYGTAMPPEGEYVRAVGYHSGEVLMRLSHDHAF